MSAFLKQVPGFPAFRGHPFRRLLAAVLCFCLIFCSTFRCYADDLDPGLDLDPEPGPVVSVPPGWDPLFGLSDEELEAYYDSFYDFPVTLLDWPEEVPQPRFATAALGTAALYLLMLLLCAAGIYCTMDTVKDFFPIFQKYEVFLRIKGDISLLASFQAVLKVSFGKAVSGMKALYQSFKEFLKSHLSGYGTDTRDYVLSGGAIPFRSGTYNIDKVKKSLTFLDAASPLYGYTFTYTHSNSTSTFYYSAFYIFSVSDFRYSYVSGADGMGGSTTHRTDAKVMERADGSVYYYMYVRAVPNFDGYKTCLASGYFADAGHFDIIDDAEAYFASAAFTLPDTEDSAAAAPVELTAVKSWGDLQRRTYASVADQILIPEQTVLEGRLAVLEQQLLDAGTADEVAATLVDSWVLGDTFTAEDGETPPITDIPVEVSGFLERILSTLRDIWDTVTSLPDAVMQVLDAVISIPARITDFFTIDTAVVGAAALSMQDAFSDRFGGVSQLAGVFSRSYSFDMAVPVFTMAVPEPLKFAFPDQDEFVILDLRPYARYFLWARGLLAAMFWVMFAKWLLDQFDVKLHVG